MFTGAKKILTCVDCVDYKKADPRIDTSRTMSAVPTTNDTSRTMKNTYRLYPVLQCRRAVMRDVVLTTLVERVMAFPVLSKGANQWTSGSHDKT